MSSPLSPLSMTGFSSAEGAISSSLKVQVEMKALNHRFLDLKLRLPRELSSVEMSLRALVQASFSRGALELKIEKVLEAADSDAPQSGPELDLELARKYHAALLRIRDELGVSAEITAAEIAAFPDVIQHASPSDLPSEKIWPQLQPIVQKAIAGLQEMRRHEGQALSRILETTLGELDERIQKLRQMREERQKDYKAKIAQKVQAAFSAYPLPESLDQQAKAVLEGRVSQELAMLLDRTDIEEELVRFSGHIDHFRRILRSGGPVGRKLDFVLQELHREINTLGNKAQDFGMSEETVQVKTKIEQLREQVMNLE